MKIHFNRAETGKQSKYHIWQAPPYIGLDTQKVNEMYEGAEYIGAYSRGSYGGWTSFPIDTFFQPNPDFSKGHSHFFGLCFSPESGNLMITDMRSAFEPEYHAVIADNNEVVFSRARHDYNASQDGSVFIDGGRDYTRSSMVPRERNCTLTFKLEGGAFLIETKIKGHKHILKLAGD